MGLFTQNLNSVLQILQSVLFFFFTGAVQGGISYLILDLGVLGRKDAFFILPAVCTCKTNTRSVGC